MQPIIEEIEKEYGISSALLQRAESSDPVNLTLKTVNGTKGDLGMVMSEYLRYLY